jgi:hypothetical protein
MAALPNASDLDSHHRNWIALMMLGLEEVDRGWDNGDGSPQVTDRWGTEVGLWWLGLLQEE